MDIKVLLAPLWFNPHVQSRNAVPYSSVLRNESVDLYLYCQVTSLESPHLVVYQLLIHRLPDIKVLKSLVQFDLSQGMLLNSVFINTLLLMNSGSEMFQR